MLEICIDMAPKDLLPSERTPIAYTDAIRAYNRRIRNIAIEQLLEKFPELHQPHGKYAIVTTGSDGREEKSNFSPMELILVYSGEVGNIPQIIEKLKEMAMLSFIDERFVEDINLQKDKVTEFQRDYRKVFPTRPLDSMFLVGNQTLANDYKNRIISEVKDEKFGKRRVERFDEQRRRSRKVLELGEQNYKGEIMTHFNEETGILFYDGRNVKGTKYGHLRATQYKIASDLFKAIRADKVGIDLLEEFPPSTVERLNFLTYGGETTLSESEVSDVTHAYLLSLYYYHLSEEYHLRRKINEMEVDVGEFKEITKILRAFSVREGNIFQKNT